MLRSGSGHFMTCAALLKANNTLCVRWDMAGKNLSGLESTPTLSITYLSSLKRLTSTSMGRRPLDRLQPVHPTKLRHPFGHPFGHIGVLMRRVE